MWGGAARTRNASAVAARAPAPRDRPLRRAPALLYCTPARPYPLGADEAGRFIPDSRVAAAHAAAATGGGTQRRGAGSAAVAAGLGSSAPTGNDRAGRDHDPNCQSVREQMNATVLRSRHPCDCICSRVFQVYVSSAVTRPKQNEWI